MVLRQSASDPAIATTTYQVKPFVKIHIKLLLFVAVLLLPAAASAQSYSIDWYKVAGGGGTSTGGRIPSAAPSASTTPAGR